MNDDLDLFGESDVEEPETPEQREETEEFSGEKYEPFSTGNEDIPGDDPVSAEPKAGETENADEANAAQTPVYESTPPVTEGEYHYGRSQQYTEPGSGRYAQDATYSNNPYANNATQQQNASYPYGGPDGGDAPQQNRNPYSQTGRQQYGAPYSQNAQQGYRNPYASGSQQYREGSNAEGFDRARDNSFQYENGAYPYAGERGGAYAYSEAPAAKKKNGGKVFIAILSVILLAVLGVVVSTIVKGARSASGTDSSALPSPDAEIIDNVDEAVTVTSPVADTNVSSSGVLSPTQIYEKVLPSSVGLLVYSNASKSLSSEGSGVIISEDNDGKYTYIITCAHVISGAGQNIMVQLYNEKEYRATIVGYDSRTDIGIIRIEEHGLQKLEIGDSTSLRVGETIYAIGNPGGTEFANTFTNGIVTALDRPVASSSTGYTMECIQHNAAINPGNSGGALVNQYGQLIGINSMKIVSSEYEGMGFAVPSSVFVDVMNDIVVNGYVTNRPKIGISYVKASAEQAYAMFVAIKGLPGGSIVIADIAEDSDFYGKLEKGDLVTAINGEDLDSSADLAAAIEGMKVGDQITLDVVRINNDYTFKEYTFTGVLVEDKETVEEEEEETSTSIFDDYFGDSYGDSDNPYSDYFDDFFGNFFGNP